MFLLATDCEQSVLRRKHCNNTCHGKMNNVKIELGLAKDVTAIYALLREGMHIKGVDMDVIYTQARTTISVGHLL